MSKKFKLLKEVKLKDGTLINIEYHTGGLYEDDLLVYLNYMSLFSLEHQQLIKQYIITTEPKEKYLKQLKNEHIFYKPEIISYKSIDGQEKLKKLENKINFKKKINKYDEIDLIFIPYMNTEDDVSDVIKKLAKLTNEATGINKKTLNKIKTSQMFVLNMLIKNEEKRGEIMQIIQKNTSLFDDFFDET